MTSLHHAGRALCAALFSLIASLPVTGTGHAQYPARPIKLLVAVAPGGAPDVIARTVADQLGPLLGQSIVVENRAGANGNIAADVVAKSPADGYTLLCGQDSIIVINPHMYAKMPLNPLKDLAAVSSLAASSAFLLVVPPSLPVKSFREFVEYARSAKPPLSYSSGGNGSLHHLAMEMLKLRAGIDLVHVPYKGGAPAVTAAIGGEVSAAVTSTVTGTYVKAGRLRALAVTGTSRSPMFPDLPAIAEFYPGYQMFSWFGMFAPAGLPEPVTARLRADIGRMLELPEVRQRLQAAGQFEPYAATPEEFANRIRTDYEKFGALVRQVGLKVD
jgi:tripartite-type tricarboxylate transporter receptor subunit TctC